MKKSTHTNNQKKKKKKEHTVSHSPQRNTRALSYWLDGKHARTLDIPQPVTLRELPESSSRHPKLAWTIGKRRAANNKYFHLLTKAARQRALAALQETAGRRVIAAAATHHRLAPSGTRGRDGWLGGRGSLQCSLYGRRRSQRKETMVPLVIPLRCLHVARRSTPGVPLRTDERPLVIRLVSMQHIGQHLVYH